MTYKVTVWEWICSNRIVYMCETKRIKGILFRKVDGGFPDPLLWSLYLTG